jgi:hypothetical protein
MNRSNVEPEGDNFLSNLIDEQLQMGLPYITYRATFAENSNTV